MRKAHIKPICSTQTQGTIEMSTDCRPMSRRQRGTSFILAVTMNRQELEEKIDELVRDYFGK
jgi:hypothetical protein